LIELILHPDRDQYSIGEAIRPRLQIMCQRDVQVAFRDFAFTWDKLAFSSPSEAHLIASHGQDLLLPYRVPVGALSDYPPLEVGPNSEEWLYLPISSHLHLRQPTTYVFWLQLLDDAGMVHQTNQINFGLVDVESSIPTGRVELILDPVRQTFPNAQTVELTVVFVNRWETPLVFLIPQQDSFDGWVNPVYQFTVVDSAGRSLPLARRSGTMSSPTYDAAHEFRIGPSNSYRQVLRLPVFPDMTNPGEYRLQLTYLVRDKAVGKGGLLLDRNMNWSVDTFIGRLESNEVAVILDHSN
jgi:hypothetical protein